MRDSRLQQVQALLDDARCTLVDIVDERPVGASLRDFNFIDSARQFINSAIVYVQKIDETAVVPGMLPTLRKQLAQAENTVRHLKAAIAALEAEENGPDLPA